MQTTTCPAKQNRAATRPTYQPRHPRRSPLYRLLEDRFEEFLLCYEELFRNQYGPLRSDTTRRTIYKYLDCGILEHGFTRVVCPQCKAEFLIGFSCKTRFCPSCHAKKLTLWSSRLVEELLEDVPHRMFTLTVPKRIRPFFLWERKLLGNLARCAAETIKQFYRHSLQEPQGTPGIVASIQTFGNQAANYHPHIHCLAADGLFASGGTFRSPSFISPVDISDLFLREVLPAFVEQELLPQEVVENMLTWPHSGFNVHIGPDSIPVTVTPSRPLYATPHALPYHSKGYTTTERRGRSSIPTPRPTTSGSMSNDSLCSNSSRDSRPSRHHP